MDSYPYYFLNIYNYVDWLLIALHIVAFATTAAASTHLDGLDYSEVDSFIDIRSVVESEQVMVVPCYTCTVGHVAWNAVICFVVAMLQQWKRLVTASALILAWFKLLEPTQLLVEEFYILVKMIILMLGKLLRSYAPLLAIVFLAWCFARCGNIDWNFVAR